MINFNEQTLEIKTTRELGTHDQDKLRVQFYRPAWDPKFDDYLSSEVISAIEVAFNHYPTYDIYPCGSGNITVDLPAALEKIWKITVSGPSSNGGVHVQIHCNCVELVNLEISNNTCRIDYDWRRYFSEPALMEFSRHFDQTDYYRLEPRGTAVLQFYCFMLICQPKLKI